MLPRETRAYGQRPRIGDSGCNRQSPVLVPILVETDNEQVKVVGFSSTTRREKKSPVDPVP